MLRRASPYQLASLTLAVLNVDVATGIFQAAIAKRAIDEDSIVKDKMLVFEDFALKSIHGSVGFFLPRPGQPFLAGANPISPCLN